MYRIGLTGGVGSGKSTVSSYMHELGIPVIDGDKLAREAVIPGSLAMNRLREVFGPHIFLPDGSLDRLKVGEIVFNDEEKRQKLNGIIHPYIWYRTREELIRAQEDGFPVVVLDMPLLLESAGSSGWKKYGWWKCLWRCRLPGSFPGTVSPGSR